ncbi:alpha/beta fold hydrolase [Caulobacter sp. 1776]|uniref:alpha/beta fold hydrolase n=1 Tax=Caulobacter sp. 1776 TaxID=3156420 RepID=UPI0033975D75
MIAGFETDEIALGPGRRLFVRRGGEGPGLLLLHGFPETHLMWREIAPGLARDFTVVCADLPGYGRSSPALDDPNALQSKRAMALPLIEAMDRLGFPRFAVVGHDRGGRVAYRMALDHPDRVSRLAVLDVIPTGAVWARADARLALAFWPFSLLAQPAPLPERLIGTCPEAVIGDALSNWGTPASVFPADLRAAYVEALRDPGQVHAICQEYRAAATIDREHDDADRAAGRRIDCPLLALWSASGGLDSWYADDGGPLGVWRGWATRVAGEGVNGGHFFPEEHPAETLERLRTFLLA